MMMLRMVAGNWLAVVPLHAFRILPSLVLSSEASAAAVACDAHRRARWPENLGLLCCAIKLKAGSLGAGCMWQLARRWSRFVTSAVGFWRKVACQMLS